MKNLFAILVVAILATSLAFSTNVGTGNVKVTVAYEDINVVLQSPGDLEIDLLVNQTKTGYQFFWLASGSPGIGFTKTDGGWTGNVLSGPGISILNGDWFSADTQFNDGGLAGFVYQFDVKANIGTIAGPYNLQYTFSLDYN